MIKCTIFRCGWLASSFLDLCLHERTTKNITWNSMTSSLLGSCLLSWSILLIASTKHLKCPLDHNFHASLPSTTLGLPTPRAARPSHREKWPLSKELFLIPTWIAFDWLTQVMDLMWWVTMNPPFFKYFSFYMFKSFSFYQMISNSHCWRFLMTYLSRQHSPCKGRKACILLTYTY